MKTILITLDICSPTGAQAQTPSLKCDIDNEIWHRVIGGSIASADAPAVAAAAAVYNKKE